MAALINVKVNPKAKINRVEQDGLGGYIVWTTAAPYKGEANQAVARALASHLGLSPSAVTLKRGAKARKKLFEVR